MMISRNPTIDQRLAGSAALMKITGLACGPDDADIIWRAMFDAIPADQDPASLPIEPRITAFDATLAHPDAKTLIARAARIAREGCLVPPDGGSPTEEERQMCARIAESIEDLL